MYQVLARRWRPQNFEELVGQSQVARTLSNAIELDRLAHAYVLAGLRGTGKTTVARILAKCLNCENGPTTTPCGECVPCREIAESRALDVLELDAASRTSVDNIRELQEVIAYPPARDRFKVLIIDEAHMLSKQAFNALLKTLEEPPPNVLFVLATTEIQKILPTILSRCQVFEFRRVTTEETSKHLRRISDQEKLNISDTSLERLARGGEGSIRDSLSLLERVVALCGREIEDDDVLRVLGAVHAQVLADLVRALAARDAAGMLTVLDGLVDEGHDLVHFWSEVIAALRDLLLLDALPDRRDLLSRAPEEADELKRAAEGLSREDLSRAFQLLADLEAGLKSSSQPRFLFEAALIRLASLGAVRPIEEFLDALASGEVAPQSAPPRSSKPPLQKKNAIAPAEGPTRAPRAAAAAPAEHGRGDIADALRESRPLIAAMLDQASHMTLDGSKLVVRFAPGMEAVKRQLEKAANFSLLEREAERLAGVSVEVSLEVADEPVPTEEPRAAAPQQPAAEPTVTRQEKKTILEDRGRQPRSTATASAPDNLLERARREPGVKKLLDTFGAQVLDIRPVEASEDGD